MINLFNSPTLNGQPMKWTQQHAFWFLLVLFSITLYAVVGNTLFPTDSLFHVSDFTVTLLGKYLSFALLALAVDVSNAPNW